MPDLINYTVRDYEGTKVIDFIGNLSANTSKSFETIVKRISEKENIILNMININIVTIAGLNSLIHASYFAKEHGKRIIVLWPNENLMEVVEMLEAHKHLIFADSLEEGKTKIKFYT